MDRVGPDDLGDDAAAIDIADQHNGNVGSPGEAHIGDVATAQVDLGRTARALDQDEVGFGLEAAEAVEDGLQEPRLPGLVLARLRMADDAALYHHLRTDLALRLQQNRIHVDGGRHPRGTGLQRLGATDLTAVHRHGGIVRHILRLERPDAETLRRIGPREPRHDQRLADVRARALHHQGLGSRSQPHGQNSIPACAFTPAAK